MSYLSWTYLAGLVLAFLFSIAFPRWTRRACGHFLSVLDQIANRPALAVICCGLISFMMNVAFSLAVQLPVPVIQDEFAYLLTADTFTHGQLTNPTPELHEHFLSHHIIYEPSYQAKYPPAQGLFLAAGQIAIGHPVFGVWLAIALAAAAQCWMLQAWTSNRWAFIGSGLFIFNDYILLHWGQSYWGGSVAWLGGSLLFGGMMRMTLRRSDLDALLMATGIGLLANSRPFEGLLVTLPAGVFLLHHWFSSRAFREGAFWTQHVVPTVAVLATTFAGMGIYNQAVTGDPFQLPYQVWLKQTGHSLESMLTGQPSQRQEGPRIPHILPMNPDDPEVEEVIRERRQRHASHRRSQQFQLGRMRHLTCFYVNPLLVVGLVSLPFQLRDRKIVLALAGVMLVYGGILSNNTFGHPHYAAPAGCLIIFLLIRGLRGLQFVRWSRVRRSASAFALTAMLLLPVMMASHYAERWSQYPSGTYRAWGVLRDQMQKVLQRREGNHLVFVRYLKGQYWDKEWVYNSSRINEQRVIWARDLGEERNARLLASYSDRTAWFALVRNEEAHLVPRDEFLATKQVPEPPPEVREL